MLFFALLNKKWLYSSFKCARIGLLRSAYVFYALQSLGQFYNVGLKRMVANNLHHCGVRVWALRAFGIAFVFQKEL